MVFVNNKVSDKLNKAILFVLSFLTIATYISCTHVDLVDKMNTKVNIKLLSLSTDVPSSYTVEINGEEVIIGSYGNLPELFPGIYPVLVYSNSPTISVINGIAQVNMMNGQLNSFPDLFFSRWSEIRLDGNSTDNIVLELEQQVRILEIRITPPSGGVYDHISTIEAKLTGVAGRWDLKNNIAVGPAMEVPVQFIKQDNGTWLAKTQLLGLFGDRQDMVGEITFQDKSSQLKLLASSLRANKEEPSLSFQSDLSNSLKAFNIGKNIPFSLSGVIELPSESGFVVSINDWDLLNETGTAW